MTIQIINRQSANLIWTFLKTTHQSYESNLLDKKPRWSGDRATVALTKILRQEQKRRYEQWLFNVCAAKNYCKVGPCRRKSRWRWARGQSPIRWRWGWLWCYSSSTPLCSPGTTGSALPQRDGLVPARERKKHVRKLEKEVQGTWLTFLTSRKAGLLPFCSSVVSASTWVEG